MYKDPIEYVFACSLIITLSPLSLQLNLPILSEICIAESSFLLSLFAQNGIREQCAEPVTGSSKIEACVVKKRETKSHSFPLDVTMNPPGSRFI